MPAPGTNVASSSPSESVSPSSRAVIARPILSDPAVACIIPFGR